MSNHFAALDYWLWLAQFCLIAEVFICQAIYRNYAFSAYALARIGFDIITFGALLVGAWAYNWTFWIAKPLEYFFFFVLGMACIANAVRENGLYARLVSVAVIFAGILAVIGFYTLGQFRYSRMLDIEIAVNMGVAILVLVALLSGKQGKPWGIISAGFLVLAASDALLGLFTSEWPQRWDVWARCYPVLEILALGVWCFAGAQQSEARTGLGVRTPECEKVVIQ